MSRISIIGMGLSPADLTLRHLEIIKQADILIGGKRHLDFFQKNPALKKEITKNISGLIKYIKNETQKKIVILASGDPLFFGIGSLLINALGAENVVVHSNISSVSAAFARIKESWHDACVLSMHGRFCENEILQTLEKKDKIAIFTDFKRNPALFAKFLIEKEITNFNMCVLEKLGSSDERVKWYKLTEILGKIFAEPNLIILKRFFSKTEQSIFLGMPDNWYAHSKGLITKSEARVVAISKLRLMQHHTLWDLGAGSGSISIEASLFVKEKIFAVEKNTEQIVCIKANKKKFNVQNLKIIQAELPFGIENLPKPDRIFIGGGGENLKEIIISACSYLKQDGIIVINTVIISNIEIALKTLQNIDFKTDIVQIQISRGRKMPYGERLKAQNPIWIISGVKTAFFDGCNLVSTLENENKEKPSLTKK